MYGQWLDLEPGYNVQTRRIMNTRKKFSWITLNITSCECKILTFFTENFTKFGKDRWELAVGFVNLTQLLTADYSKVEILEKPPSFHVPGCQMAGTVVEIRPGHNWCLNDKCCKVAALHLLIRRQVDSGQSVTACWLHLASSPEVSCISQTAASVGIACSQVSIRVGNNRRMSSFLITSNIEPVDGETLVLPGAATSWHI